VTAEHLQHWSHPQSTSTLQEDGAANTTTTTVSRFTYDQSEFNALDLIAQLESDFPESVLPAAGPA